MSFSPLTLISLHSEYTIFGANIKTIAIHTSNAVDYPAIDVSLPALREGNRKKPIYAMHKWWARRLGTVFRMLLVTECLRADRKSPNLLEMFYSKGELPQDFTVLDPFLGGGMVQPSAG